MNQKTNYLVVILSLHYECLWGPCQFADWCFGATHTWGRWSCMMVSGTPTPTSELAMPTVYWLLPPFIEQTFKGYVVPSSVGCWDVRYNGESSNHVGSDFMELLLCCGVPTGVVLATRRRTVCRKFKNNRKTDWKSVCILISSCAHNSKPCHW